MEAPRGVKLLSVDPDLGEDLSPEDRAHAEQELVLAAVELEMGPLAIEDLEALPAVRGRPLGILIIDGVLVERLTLGARDCVQLLGPGDVIGYDDDSILSLPAVTSVHVVEPSVVAVLDDRFLAAGARWPRFMGRVFVRATRQMREVFLHQAIAQLPRVENRLVALFWSLADRWGRMRPDGVVVDLAITHDTIGQLIGARRPTVSLGLTALAKAGTLRHEEDGWHLSNASLGELEDAGAMIERGARLEAPGADGDGDGADLRARLLAVRNAAESARRRRESALDGDGHGDPRQTSGTFTMRQRDEDEPARTTE